MSQNMTEAARSPAEQEAYAQSFSYAMRNEEATGQFLSFHGDLLNWTFYAIEGLVILGFILTCMHAWKQHKNGAISPMLTLVACFIYGLWMDIVSYYTVESFWHGEFTVMFVWNRLPLYIALFYPTFMYHMYMTIRRYEFPKLKEAVISGFFAGLVYLIFDNLGPAMQWWVWDLADPTNQPYLNAVPLTSYGWFFLFTTSFAYFARTMCWDWVDSGASKNKLILGATVFVPLLTIVVGVLLFTPFNIFAYSALIEMAAFVHAATFFMAGWWYVSGYKKPAQSRDRLLMFWPLLYIAGHLFIYMSKFDMWFRVTEAGTAVPGYAGGAELVQMGNLIAVILAAVAGIAILILSHPPEKD